MQPSCLVGQRIFSNFPFLKKLALTTSLKKRNDLIGDASCEELAAIVEACFNIIKGNFKISERRLKGLRNHAPELRSLARARTAPRAKKVLQTGNGFLPALLIPVLLEASRYLLK